MQQPDPTEPTYTASVTIIIRGGEAWAHIEVFDSAGTIAECWKGQLPVERAGQGVSWAAGLGEYIERWNNEPGPF